MAVDWASSLIVTNLELDIAGASVEGPRSLNGLTGAIDMTGGGLWTARGMVDVFTDAQHRDFWKMKAILDGGVTSVNFPLQVEKFGVKPTETLTELIFNNTAAEGDTSIRLRLTGENDGEVLQNGMIIGVHHDHETYRAYIIRNIDDHTVFGAFDRTVYDVKIRPPLRADTDASQVFTFAPIVRMRVPAGQQMPWPVAGNDWHRARAAFNLVEAIPAD